MNLDVVDVDVDVGIVVVAWSVGSFFLMKKRQFDFFKTNTIAKTYMCSTFYQSAVISDFASRL